MRKTKVVTRDDKIAIDVHELAERLSCGEYCARKIGEAAEARIEIGRRVLYSVDKITAFIEAEAQ